MKRIFCPKCDTQITFDETKCDRDKPIAFVCVQCCAQFKIRLGKKIIKTDAGVDKEVEETGFTCGSIFVIENGFGYKQELPLILGNNTIGRRNKDTEKVEVPIITVDPSMGRKHCIINVKSDKKGGYIYTLRDFPSLTGTFLCNLLLGKREQARIEAGAVVTIGATTFILRGPEHEEEK